MLKYTARGLFNSIRIRTNVSRVSHEIEMNGFHCGVTCVLYFHLLSPVFFIEKGAHSINQGIFYLQLLKTDFKKMLLILFRKIKVLHAYISGCSIYRQVGNRKKL